MPVMSPWSMTISPSVAQTSWLRRKEEDMEADVPARSTAPMPPKESLRWESYEAGDPDDLCSQMSEESMDQNLPHDSDLNEDELLGMVTDLSVPGGHSDDSIALGVCPGEDDL